MILSMCEQNDLNPFCIMSQIQEIHPVQFNPIIILYIYKFLKQICTNYGVLSLIVLRKQADKWIKTAPFAFAYSVVTLMYI